MAAKSTRTRRMRRRQWSLGGAATVAACVMMLAGWLDRAEWVTQDWRARWFGRWSPAPSPDIVIVGIDDRALREVQRWPWHRATLASAVREMTRAGAKVVALDVLLDDPQEPRTVAGSDVVINDDEELAAAVREHGSVIAAALFKRSDEEGPRKLTVEGLLAMVRRHEGSLAGMDAASAIGAAGRAMQKEYAADPDGPPVVDRQTLARLLDAARRLEAAAPTSSRPINDSEFTWFARSSSPVPPIEPLCRAAAQIADVAADTHDPGGVVRRVPAVVDFDTGHWPSMGLSAAARQLGVPFPEVRIGDGGTIVLPRAGGEGRQIPTRRGWVGRQYVDGLYELTWPRGGHQWLGQFSQDGPSEISIGAVLEPVLIARAVASNLRELDELVEYSKTTEESARRAFHERGAELVQLSPDDPRWAPLFAEHEKLAGAVAAGAREFLDFAGQPDPGTISPDDAKALASYRALADGIPALLGECREAPRRIDAARSRLRDLVGGKLCFVGWTATSGVGIADQVNTSIAPQTPGVYIHAAVANSVLTGFARRPLSGVLSLGCVLALGLAGTVVGSRVRVELGPVVMAALVVGWFMFVGVVLWDAAWIVGPVVGPSLAAGGAWLAVILHRLLVEQRARQRTEERFRSYVSPAVVDILVENPGLSSMAPQRRELTVMFSDLVGFTAAAERLGAARTGAVLGRYLGAMTEALQAHGATLDKYLGDGIMAFWGAPIENPRHAADACRAVLAMQGALAELNREGAFGEAGALSMRIGLGAGELMVGDFGNPPRNSSYTVLGDASNLASRLESAGRRLGTSILASSRVRELAGEGFAWRRIGRVAVQGRRQAEEVFELLGAVVPGSSEDGRVGARISLTEDAVGAFARGDFGRSAELWGRLEREFGEGRLAGVYREAIGRWSGGPGGGARTGFDGTIELTDK